MRSLYLLLIINTLAGLMGYAQNLHVFSVIETSNPRRADRQHDADRLHRLVDDVARYGNYTVHWYDFGDSTTFTAHTVRATLEKLRLRSADQDIVWFYFSGLGHSDSSRSWPTLHLNGGELPMRDVMALLRPQAARTLLITADCGNGSPPPVQLVSNEVGDDSAPGMPTRIIPAKAVQPRTTQVALADVPPIQLVDNYRRLFRTSQVRQVILISSATYGQRSFSEPTRGSVWLQSFVRSITEAVRHPVEAPTWAGISKRSIQYTKERTQNRQIPSLTRETTTCCEHEPDF